MNMKQLRNLLLTLLALSAISVAIAQPANDNFGSRFVVVGSSISTNGTTVSGTRETGEPAPFANPGPSSWYEWVAPSSAATTVAISGSYRETIAAYTGSAVNALTGPAGSSTAGFGGTTASFNFNPTAGTTYMIQVSGRNASSGTFTLTINQAVTPVVTITSPTAGQNFTNPATITLSANATSPSGTVTNVSFYYAGNTLIGSDTNAPFSLNWSGMADGNYTITARATDTAGQVGTSAGINITVRPAGYFSAQLIGSNSVAGSNSWWTYKDDGSDQGTAWQSWGFDDSSWARGPGQLGYGDGDEATVVEDNPTPGYNAADTDRYATTYFRHAFTVNNVNLITNLVARFLRDDGVVAYLNGVEVIRNNMTNGQDYLSYTANATDDGNTFFSTNISPALLTNGVNVFTAELHQNTPSSSDVTWYLELTGSGAGGNPAPTVAITSPANGAVFSAGTSATVNANASDSNGSVTNVAFYLDGTNFLGNDTAAPYTASTGPLVEGSHTLTAVATDDEGASAVSLGISITVNSYAVTPVTLIASNSVWKYLDDGSDQGTAWSATAFDDTTWLSGPAELGYGDLPEGRPEATVLCCSNAPTKFITYYFRKTFAVSDASTVSNLVLQLMRDDGAVVYLNGVEQWRDNMPAGAVTSLTPAVAAVSGAAEATYFTNIFGPTNLVSGNNVLAVEIHQNANTSSDVSFDLELVANTLNIVLPTNTAAPHVVSQNPVRETTVGSLTSIQVVFSEAVTNVNAGDLLVNGAPATGLSGGPAIYTFTFPQPAFGLVNITWAVGHGITDRDPAPLPFDGNAATNIWSYNLSDVIAPTVAARNPAAGAIITNLTSVNVTFSENVSGVNAGDLLVNGTPASGLVANNGSNYTFTFSSPLPGTVSINWISAHGITDTSPSANAFNTNSAGANWTYNLTVPSTALIASNSVWKYFKGLTEASTPVQAWRQIGFDDSAWASGATPFNYSTPYTDTYTNLATGPGTYLADMQGGYQSVYLRSEFVLVNPSAVSNFIYKHQIDDGLVAWINGVEVLRVNMAASGTDPSFQPTGVGNANEPANVGAAYVFVTNTAALGALVAGTNILAVQACNASLAGSSDFGFNLQFEATIIELNPSNLPPRIFASAPASGDVSALSSVSFTFSEPVSGVNAADLLVNGVPASGLSNPDATNFIFTFPQPAYGPVAITWAPGHGIADFDAPPKAFDGNGPGATLSFSLVNPNAPVVATQSPIAGATVSSLTNVLVTFSKNVSGVDAADLLVAGTPAVSVSGSGSNYSFSFPQPPYGSAGLSWASNNAIFATGSPADTFDRTRPGNTWSYSLIDLTPPVVAGRNPPASANVTNITQLTVTFSESVLGVNASDLTINGVPATGLSGGGNTYTFTFAQPNTSVVNVNWGLGHGITDSAGNPFNPASPGNSWQYFTPDNVPPAVAAILPPPNAVLRSLSQIQISFTEPVTGVQADDFFINGAPAASVSGADAGPYTFSFTQPATGAVEIIWLPSALSDLASPPNYYNGDSWTYTLDPNAVFADKIVFNEIMYLPGGSHSTNDEWLELKNTDSAPLSLSGWRLASGVSFTFPNITIPAGGYLVIAANTNAFAIKYPAVTNVIGGWVGNLANNGEKLRLETTTGESVNEVDYATEGDWAARQVGPSLGGFRGWVWNQPADGFGPSLELVQPGLPNAFGQNWRASAATNGTPGSANSQARTNLAPMVLNVAHFPLVPRSTQAVTVAARILDERTNGLAVTLLYRTVNTTTPGAFSSVTMFDDGAHNDGPANDRVWAGSIPAQADQTVVEFVIRAVDADNNTNHWPAVAYNAADQGSALRTPETSANALYQVDNTPYTSPQPQYKLILTEQERRNRDASSQNAEFNCTFISLDGTGSELRYLCAVRERGAGSRGAAVPNHRVNIPTDHRWKGQREINLNSQTPEAQYAGYLLTRKAGLDCEWSRVIRVFVNGTNNQSASFGVYVHNEAPDSEFATAHWPLDDGGNVYRISSGGHTATLAAHQPPTSQTYSNLGYLKASNSAENDYSDLTNLTYVLNIVPNNIYEASVRSNVNVENWLLYFAVNTLLANAETSVATGIGDDAGMYHAPIENKFYFYAHDWDSVLGLNGSSTTQPIMIATALPSISRFLTWSNFANQYTNLLRTLCRTTFSPGEVAKTLDEGLGSFASTASINAMKQWMTNRVANVLSQLTSPDPNTPNVAPTNISGAVSNNLVLAASNGIYFVTGTLTINSGATLSIEPGVAVRLASGANLVVANGGRLLAGGTADRPILFTRSGGVNWGSIIINGGAGSPESVIRHARIEFNATSTSVPAIEVAAGTAVLDYLTFGNTASPYIHVDGASFVISHCEFPSPTASFEPVHGTLGVKSGGRGIFFRNFFGKLSGYNDSIDFTGGNRPGSPVVQFVDNVFMGSDDDILDLDGTDAWVEGNIFLHAHRNGSPDSASAVSGGNDSGQTSEITVIGNIFYDNDQAATAKQGNYYAFINNTVVHQSGAGFGDAGVTAVLNFADEGIAQARGMYVEGNVLYDVERLTRNVTNATTVANNTFFNGNLWPAGLSWGGPGATNLTNTPLFKFVPTVAQTTNFTNWAAAQVLRDWFSLLPGSAGVGNGPNGADKGVIPIGATVAVGAGGGPNDATFTVGVLRSNAVTAAAGGFPLGAGYTHYKWRLDGGPWSAETPAGSSIAIPGFRAGAHRFDVTGKRDAGTYQDEADYGELALVTSVFSQPAQKVVINEVLASNGSSVNHEGSYPDIIELHNPGAAAVDIGGLRLTDDQNNPDKFIFDPGTFIPAGGYLVVYANNPDGTSGLHAGFNVAKDGQSIYLYDTVDNGGVLIDSIKFGLQLTDYSVGRLGTNWALGVPTPGGPNVPAVTGPVGGLVINEILAAELTAFPDDFVELFNGSALPVNLAGLYFTDNPINWPTRSPVPALTFIAGGGYIAFHADGNKSKGADHLDFNLAAERGIVALLDLDLSVIDCVIYGSQSTDISQGRVPQNIFDNNFFSTPTPGAPNPGLISTNSGVVLNEVLAANGTIAELDGSTPDWVELYNLGGTNIDLGDYSLSDDSLAPRKYVFAPGTIITGGGYVRLRCDGSLPGSSTNTGFNIKAEGGSVYLFAPLAQGGALLNAVTYGLQATDYSISRLPNGTGPWGISVPTPGAASLAAATAAAALVKVNEWMPRPSSGDDWFELWNPSAQPVAIGGYYLTDDLVNRTKSPIPGLSFLGASTNGYQRFWADSNPANGANHTSFALNNTAESVGFSDPLGTLIDGISYTSPTVGVSEGRFLDGSATIVRFPGTESPGDANYLLLTNIVINEALTHTDPPLEDAIELRNLSGSPVNIGNWWLSDARGTPRKYRIPSGVTIPANGFVVFYETQFNNGPLTNFSAFSLSSAKGDEVYLSTADSNGVLTGFRRSVDFGAAANGVSFGRYVTSDGREEFTAMSARSFGQDDPGTLAQFRTGTGLANPYPKVGPIVIAQVMYHPPDVGTNDNTLEEFIELRNTSGSAVTLYDPLAPTNTWRLRDAVDFDFPMGVSMPGNTRLLLVSFDPVSNPAQLASFRAKYGADGTIPVYGPYSGKLANNDDKVELYKPDNPDAGFVPFVLVDRVHYYDAAPWPTAADGTGAGLSRVSLSGYANDPTNWVAVVPNFGGGGDSDGDGMPDWWESLYAPTLNPANPADANLDPDGDGMSNLNEYIAGTNPTQASSALRFISVEATGGNNARMYFNAVSNRSYSILYKNGMVDATWTKLFDVNAATTNRTLQINTTVSTNRFFWLRTPQAP